MNAISRICIIGCSAVGAVVGFDYTLRRLGGLSKRPPKVKDLDQAEIEPDLDFEEGDEE